MCIRDQDDGIADHFAGELDWAVHDVVKANGVLGNAQPDRRRFAICPAALAVLGIERAAFSGVDRRLLMLQSMLAVTLQFLLRAEAEIRFAFFHPPLGMLAIQLQAIALAIGRERTLGLLVGALVPIDAEPLEIVEKLALEARLATREIS